MADLAHTATKIDEAHQAVIDGKPETVFDTAPDMLVYSDFKDSLKVRLGGYHSRGDGGGGALYYDSSATDVPNGGTVFVPDDNRSSASSENIGTGDGSQTTFSVGNTPVVPGFIATGDPNNDTPAVEVVATIGGTSETFTGDGDGLLRGNNSHTADIDYAAGTVDFDTAPDNGTSVTATYDYASSAGRIVRSIHNGEIHTDHFGVDSSGSETKAKFRHVVKAARRGGYSIRTPDGTIKLDLQRPLDFGVDSGNGWPGCAGITGRATFDLSGGHDGPTGALFRAKGSITQLDTGISVTKGDDQLSLSTGHGLKRGDVLLIVSDEDLPNKARSYYYKGTRLQVDDYDSGTGTTDVYPNVDFDYDGAANSVYVYKVEETLFKIGGQVTFEGVQDGQQRCLELYYTRFDISGSFRHFGERAIAAVTSAGRFSGYIRDTHYSGTSTSYGFSYADLSDVHVVGAEVWGGRHGITGIGGGFHDLSLVGGASSSEAGYPSRVTVNGGTYGCYGPDAVGGIDSHGLIKEMVVSGATVYDGITLNADKVVVDGCNIYFHNWHGLYIGSGVQSQSWGTVRVSDSTVTKMGGTGVTSERSFLELGNVAGNRSVEIVDNTFRGEWQSGSSANPWSITKDIARLAIKRNRFEVVGTPSDVARIFAYSDVDVTHNEVVGHSLRITAKVADLTCDISGSRFRDSNIEGCRIWKDTETDDWQEIIAHGTQAWGCQSAGLRLADAELLSMYGAVLRDNGQDTGGSNAERTNLFLNGVAEVKIHATDLGADGTTKFGLFMNPHASLATTLAWSGVDTRGVTDGSGTSIDSSVDIIQQLGITADANTEDILQKGSLVLTRAGDDDVTLSFKKADGGNSMTIQFDEGNGYLNLRPTGAAVELRVSQSGTVEMPSLPTTDPTNPGELWNDAGTLKIST